MASRTTLVFGGTSGIGLATARQLAARGETVHVAGRSAERVASVRVEAPELSAHVADGTDHAAVAALAEGVAPIDALVITISSSAGNGPLAELDLAELRKGFDEKVLGMLTVMQAALPHLSPDASITLVGAISAHTAMPGTAGIGAINAAVEALVRPLSIELAPRRVNAVSPGLVDTPWWNALPAETRDAYFSAAEAALPVGHVSTADEVGEAVVLLATNSSMTGTVVPVDGGVRFVQL
ncbi:SDR family oxidoreductase [Lentzea sp. NPDC059081]|uniref:SDR family oxidoreductase n=1 Tax=Lentzea sp. NPDC059081 TaxID=3346719 RepID=UPI0036C4ACF8